MGQMVGYTYLVLHEFLWPLTVGFISLSGNQKIHSYIARDEIGILTRKKIESKAADMLEQSIKVRFKC